MAKTDTKERKLTTKQEAFALYYATSGNVLQSALKAGYAKSTATVDAHSFLDNPRIAEAVERHQVAKHTKAELLEVSPEWIVSQLAQRAADSKNPSASVSALRTLADIFGLLQGNRTELPDALNSMLEATAEAIRSTIPKPVSRGISQPVIEGTGRIVDESTD